VSHLSSCNTGYCATADPTSRTQTIDGERIAAAIHAMRAARADGGFPLSRETTPGFVTPRNRPAPASWTERPARTASPLRDASAPARVSTKRVHCSGSHSPCTGKAPLYVPSFWSKPGPARPFLETDHKIPRRSVLLANTLVLAHHN
jgi:hypothetical protein